eukprot:PITA_27703
MARNYMAAFLIVAVVLGWAHYATAASAEYVCDPSKYQALGLNIKDLPFCDKSLSFLERAKDLVSRLTLAEKVGQMGSSTSGVQRLGIPKYEWWSEALHGVSNTGPGVIFEGSVPSATSFPLVILTAASFNETLWRTIGEVVSTEARAMHNAGLAGLTYWSPNINVLRDPRWGRAQETPGEDPYLVGRYAVNYVKGLQDHPNATSGRLKVAACCKHYTAYDLDRWKNITRFDFNSEVTQQDMKDTFQPPFETCIEDGGGSSAMCSFNQIDGIPPCADPRLLEGTIRGEWKLNGYIVSDCDSIEVLFHHQSYTKTPEEAVAYVLRAGLDLDCGKFYPKYLESAVLKGKVRESDIDQALIKTYIVLMRVGWFEIDEHYANLGPKDICTAQNQELAVEAARQGIVLLENNGKLPLSTDHIKTLAVVGPQADATESMIGLYAGIPCNYTPPAHGLAKFAKVVYRPGCFDVRCNHTRLIQPAVKAAKEADATIVVVGLDLDHEREGWDRVSLYLPGYQTELVTAVASSSKGPVILVILSGGGVDVTFAQNFDNISAVLWAGYPGQGGGDAIAQVIFGKYNPGGRLPMTWYPQKYVNQVNYTIMNLRANSSGFPGRTYRFYKGHTVYPFGYGLSYTNFTYRIKSQSPEAILKVPLAKNQKCYSLFQAVDPVSFPCESIRVEDYAETCEGLNIEIDIEVKNTGKRDGSDVVQVYSVPPSGLSGAPEKRLIAFKRVFVKVQSSEIVSIEVNACESLGVVDNAAYQVLPAGYHTLLVGDRPSKSRNYKPAISIPLLVSLNNSA